MQTPEDRMVHWINERYRMYCLKENGHKGPLTEDPILHAYRFCNVHRENDKVTRWIAQHWRNPHVNYSNLTAAIVLARMFNLPDHLAELHPFVEWDIDDMCRVSKERRARGEKCFNGAYLITTCGVKMDKIDYVYRVVEDVYNDRVFRTPCYVPLADYHARLMNTKGLGSFLAAQVVADLKNAPDHPLQQAQDRLTWCAPGPGSIRGLRRLTGVSTASKRHFLGGATAAFRAIGPRLNPMPGIDMQDFQNCLCEFDKYERTYMGEGKPKQRYSHAK